MEQRSASTLSIMTDEGKALQCDGEQSSERACAERSWEGLECGFTIFAAVFKYVALKCLSLLLCSLLLLVQLFMQLCDELAHRPFAVKNSTSLFFFFLVVVLY